MNESSVTLTDQIAANLRQRIIRGEIPPGGRLPSWNDLGESFRVTRTTLSRVFNPLREDGFVVSSPKRGAYAAEFSPHRYRHGLVFPESPGDPGWNRFWRTLSDVAQSYRDEAGNHFACFYGVHTNLENASHNRLLRDVASDRLASLTVVGHPQSVSPWVWERAGLARIGIWPETPDWPTPSVYFDRSTFISKSLDYLVSRGRRRVALLTNPAELLEGFVPAAAQRGIHMPGKWRLSASAAYARSVRPIVELLMSAPSGERPDGLIIGDDNLVEDAVETLLAIDPNMPAQLDVVGHCNWPAPVETRYPIRFLGFDSREVLATSISLAGGGAGSGAMKTATRTFIAVGARFEPSQADPA